LSAPVSSGAQTAAGAAVPLVGTSEKMQAAGAGGGAAAGSAVANGQAPPSAAPPAAAPPSAVPPGLAQPRVVRTAQLQVEVRRGTLQRAFDRMSAIAAANGGFVASSSTTNGDASA